MGLELTDQESDDLISRTKKLLEILADAWDPDAGETAQVRNKYLEDADKLCTRWRAVKWAKHK